MHFTGERTKGPGLMQGSAGFQLGPCPQQVNATVPLGAQTAPLCEDTQASTLWGHLGHTGPCHKRSKR